MIPSKARQVAQLSDKLKSYLRAGCGLLASKRGDIGSTGTGLLAKEKGDIGSTRTALVCQLMLRILDPQYDGDMCINPKVTSSLEVISMDARDAYREVARRHVCMACCLLADAGGVDCYWSWVGPIGTCGAPFLDILCWGCGCVLWQPCARGRWHVLALQGHPPTPCAWTLQHGCAASAHHGFNHTHITHSMVANLHMRCSCLQKQSWIHQLPNLWLVGVASIQGLAVLSPCLHNGGQKGRKEGGKDAILQGWSARLCNMHRQVVQATDLPGPDTCVVNWLLGEAHGRRTDRCLQQLKHAKVAQTIYDIVQWQGVYLYRKSWPTLAGLLKSTLHTIWAAYDHKQPM